MFPKINAITSEEFLTYATSYVDSRTKYWLKRLSDVPSRLFYIFKSKEKVKSVQ